MRTACCHSMATSTAPNFHVCSLDLSNNFSSTNLDPPALQRGAAGAVARRGGPRHHGLRGRPGRAPPLPGCGGAGRRGAEQRPGRGPAVLDFHHFIAHYCTLYL